eukprot:NODE_1283_length_1396_cov_80.367218_g1272_i0.p1 GENE.NODE_1283_length_1396_cov_80.367218_g1272_i0~~NODE_1283_length_1396_cov_80.367218_g1272_i0.p1  ORF type:complete len:423 (+),score=55.09 NODE_1283_length_1396_cov_80.367218_g1272_i0:76-1344(+)
MAAAVRGVCTMEGHTGTTVCLAFQAADEGGLLASGSEDGTVRLWDTTSKACLQTLPHGGAVTCVSISDDGSILSGSTDRTIVQWAASGEKLRTLTGSRAAVRSCVSADENIIGGGADGCVYIWGPEGPPQRFTAHADAVSCVVYGATEEGPRLFTASYDHVIKAWDLAAEGGPVVVTKFSGHTNHVRGLSLMPDGRLVSCSRDETVRVWDPATGQCQILLTLPSPINGLQCLNNLVYCGCSDGRVRVLLMQSIGNHLKTWMDKQGAELEAKRKAMDDKLALRERRIRKETKNVLERKRAEMQPAEGAGDEEMEEDAQRDGDGGGEALLAEIEEQLNKECDDQLALLQRDLELKKTQLGRKYQQAFAVPAEHLADNSKARLVHLMQHSGHAALAVAVSAGGLLFVTSENDVVARPASVNTVHF